MYLDMGTILAIIIALSAQLIVTSLLLYTLWRQSNSHRLTNDSVNNESDKYDIWN